MERQDQSLFPSLREYAMRFGLTQEKLDALNKEITIMHPGPINRGVEITSEVADGPHSIILPQVENGVAVRMAVLYLLASQINR
jgi:aspartate carbamoyltransferase catalytic subunit